MSDAETKTAVGKCAEISERGEWTTFSIQVDGWEHPLKLSTKLAPLVELGRAASKSGGVFEWTYTEKQGKENPHRPGTYYMDRYLSGVEPAAEGAQAAPAATGGSAGTSASPQGQMTKEEWARKDSAIHRMAATKAAADALKHTVPADPTSEDLSRFIDRVKTVSYQWWKQADAVREGDDSDVPFLSEHDDGIPY